MDVAVADLQAKSAGGELNSHFFHLLISDDPVDDVLTWLADPEGSKDRWDANRWETLCSRLLDELRLRPGPRRAAGRKRRDISACNR